MQVSPHNPNSAISTLASVHLMANIPNALVLEYVDDEQDAPWRNDSVDRPTAGGKWLPATPNETGAGLPASDEGSGKISGSRGSCIKKKTVRMFVSALPETFR